MTTSTPRLQAPETELFLIPAEVSQALHLSRGQLRRMRDTGTGPAYFTIGYTIRYLPPTSTTGGPSTRTVSRSRSGDLGAKVASG